MRYVAFLPLLVGCAPLLEDSTPYLDEPRLLAVRAEPAEVKAGESVTFTGFVADQNGAMSTAAITWGFCGTPRPLAELGPIATVCLDPSDPSVAVFGDSLEATGVVPANACALFGPDPPPSIEGQPAGRPADPDVTGGYYQPAVAFPVDPAGDPLLAPIRVRCGIANVSQETYIAWNQGYTSNLAPMIAEFTVDGTVIPADGEGDVPAISGGEPITFEAAWPTCDTAPCAGAESYLVYDPLVGELVTRREAISVTWFATGGEFGVARNGRSGDESELSVTNTWTPPTTPGDVWVGVSIRDERGGVDFSGYTVHIN